MNANSAVFFISFGGPEKKEDVMPFLEIVTRGRGIPRERLLDVARHYAEIGGSSPINAITRQQAEGLKKQLMLDGTPLPVYVGNRNWHPFIEDTLRQMIEDGVQRAVGFITAAHRTEASLERYVCAVEAAREKIGAEAPVIDYVGPWFDHPLFIETMTERVKEALLQERSTGVSGHRSNDTEAWIFTAHSIPCSMAKESTYVQELRRTAELICRSLGRSEWSLAYSSRSGKPEDAWLEPDVGDAIRAKAQAGIRKILLVPIGFIADHVEVLFDLDVEAKAAATAAGVQLARAKTAGDHPTFLRLMSAVVRLRLQDDPILALRAQRIFNHG